MAATVRMYLYFGFRSPACSAISRATLLLVDELSDSHKGHMNVASRADRATRVQAGRASWWASEGHAEQITLALKEAILAALEQVGGVEYLARMAEANPASFLALLGKVLPLDVKAHHSGAVIAEVIFRGLNDHGEDA